MTVLAAWAALGGGCTPTCKQTCEKLLDCEDIETSRVNLADCQNTCETQKELYDRWDDTQLQDALDEAKRCIRDEECSAIADGACYDEDLYAW